MDPARDKWRIIDSLYSGAATAKDIAIEHEMRPRYVERILIDAFHEGLVTRKLFMRYRVSVYIYELARTKKTQ